MSWETRERMWLEDEMVSQPVRSLQHMLRRLSLRYSFLPELQPDGRFGERTLEAVMQFQKNLHPPVTGVVDETLELMLELERELAGPRLLRGFPEGGKAAVGESREFLYVVQAMFQALSNVLEEVEEERIDAIHSGSSVNNVMWLQGKAGLPQSGEMNRETWDALARLYELFVVRRPHGVVPALGKG